MSAKGKNGKKGTILLQAVIMIVVVAGIAGSLVALTGNDRRAATHRLERVGAQAAADGATQMALEAVLQQAANTRAFPADFDGNVNMNGYASPRVLTAPESDPSAGAPDTTKPWTSIRYHVRRSGSGGSSVDPDGFTTSTQQYHVWATAFMSRGVADPRRGDGSITVHRMANVGVAGVFQYAVFYSGDLEIVHNATMTVSGRVQCNADTYLDPGSPLNFKPVPGASGAESYVHTAGNFYREQPNFPVWGGTLDVQVNGSPVPWSKSVESTSPSWKSTMNGSFTDTGATSPVVQDGALGATAVKPPDVGSFSNGGFYDTNAGLNIKYDGTTMTATSGGVDVTAALEASGALSTTTFWDQRAEKNVSVVDIDVGKLGDSSTGHFPGNGLVYVSRSDSSPSAPNGVRLKNGKTLPAGMTLCSPNPVYVQGDFNAKADGTPGYSSSILCDALTLQSNAWKDSDPLNQGQRVQSSDNPLGKSGPYTIPGEMPVAADTTYNMAFVAGNTLSNYAAGVSTLANPNQSGFSNGGLNNLPRFLETWTGKNCNVAGSMVCLFQSKIATAPFSANDYVYNQSGSGAKPSKPVNGSIYNPPIRNWAYDPGLMKTPPPMSPVVVRLVESVYWTN